MPAVPWIKRVLSPEIPAARCSDTQLFAVPGTLFQRFDRPYARGAIALAILARTGTDIPVLALALLLGSLLAALAAARERPTA